MKFEGTNHPSAYDTKHMWKAKISHVKEQEGSILVYVYNEFNGPLHTIPWHGHPAPSKGLTMWQPAWASLSRESTLTLHAWYLDFLSHHLPHVKRLLVRCQYDKHLMLDCVHAQTRCGRPLHHTHYSHMHTSSHSSYPLYSLTHAHSPPGGRVSSSLTAKASAYRGRGGGGREEAPPEQDGWPVDEYQGPQVCTCIHTQCLPQRMSALVTCVVELSTFVWCCLYWCISLGHKCVCVVHNFVVNCSFCSGKYKGKILWKMS